MIAGGSGGIGVATARRVAMDGGTVVVMYHSRAEVASHLVKEICDGGGTAMALQADLARAGEPERAVQETLARFGQLDSFISLVGITTRLQDFLTMTDEDIDRHIEVELKGTITSTRAVLAPMVEQGRGRIVLVGSDSGKGGAPREAASSACRGGIIAFARAIGREFARHSITINVVCPGPVDTEVWQEMINSEHEMTRKVIGRLLQVVPMGRPATAEEVANVTAFLASDEASFVTGQAVSVSGGLTMC